MGAALVETYSDADTLGLRPYVRQSPCSDCVKAVLTMWLSDENLVAVARKWEGRRHSEV